MTLVVLGIYGRLDLLDIVIGLGNHNLNVFSRTAFSVEPNKKLIVFLFKKWEYLENNKYPFLDYRVENMILLGFSVPATKIVERLEIQKPIITQKE